MVKKNLRKVIAGFFVFLLAALAFFSFEEAIFTPLVNWITAVLGGSPYTYWVILLFSCLLLVYVFRRELPFTSAV